MIILIPLCMIGSIDSISVFSANIKSYSFIERRDFNIIVAGLPEINQSYLKEKLAVSIQSEHVFGDLKHYYICYSTFIEIIERLMGYYFKNYAINFLLLILIVLTQPSTVQKSILIIVILTLIQINIQRIEILLLLVLLLHQIILE